MLAFEEDDQSRSGDEPGEEHMVNLWDGVEVPSRIWNEIRDSWLLVYSNGTVIEEDRNGNFVEFVTYGDDIDVW